MWSGHTLSGGNGRDDGSAPSFRIDVTLAPGEAGPCRTKSQELNRAAAIAGRRVNGATAHDAAERLAAELRIVSLLRRRICGVVRRTKCGIAQLRTYRSFTPSSISLRSHKERFAPRT